MGIQLEKTPRLDFVFSGTLRQGRARVSPGPQEQIYSIRTKHWSESLWISLSAWTEMLGHPRNFENLSWPLSAITESFLQVICLCWSHEDVSDKSSMSTMAFTTCGRATEFLP